MLNNRLFVSLIATVLLYTPLVLLLFSRSVDISAEQKPIKTKNIITLSVSEFVPQSLPPAKKTDSSRTETPSISEQKPIFVPKKEMPEPISKISTPNKKTKKAIQKSTIKKRVKKVSKKNKKQKRKTAKKKNTNIKKQVQKSINQKRKTNPKRVPKKKSNSAKKRAFLTKLRVRIDRAKRYPRIAQKRKMQGSVKVQFTILSNGSVSNIKIRGKRVFYKPTREAIKKAFPVSAKMIPFALPVTVNLTLRYHLR